VERKRVTEVDETLAIRPYNGIRLIEFEIERLFDEFDYTIPLNLENHVTAIIAPNGTGKTLCLRMIAALFEQKWSVFADNIFSKILYKFNEGTTVEIDKKPPDDSDAPNSDNRPSLRIVIRNGSGDLIDEWSPRLGNPRHLTQVERYIPFLTRVGPNVWRHDNTGEAYNLSEVIEAYGDSFPESIRANLFGRQSETLTAITSEIDCHLIETQRLLILRDEGEEIHYRNTRRPPSTLAIARKAEALKSIISQQINVYATLSQSLDRSFPKRVISHPTTLASEELKAQLEDLDQKRKALMDAGILDTEADDPVSLPEGTLEAAMARVLSVYADDTRRKLASLADLLAKITLFKELIDERFITNDVRITRQNGIEVIFKDRKVPIERLSSGEQHQLVLFFELLFEIKQNALILIDEPELSLHVAWQKKFISDLMKIIDLNRFDVILATHSPQLIGRWVDLVVELGDVYEGHGRDEIED
jgi:ABC-type transport system involved in cytochrome c biogenesis ATPase subunit